MKFKLVETYNDYELDDLRDLVQEYLYDAVDELKSASLETYLGWFTEQLEEYDVDYEALKQVVTDAYIDLIDYKKIKGTKTMITSDLKDYIEQHADLLDNNIDELINQCPGYLEHELELVLSKLNESLNEELLTEDRHGGYAKLWSQFDELVDIGLDEDAQKTYELHHINPTIQRSKSGDTVNYVILPREVHNHMPSKNNPVELYKELKTEFNNCFKTINVSFDVLLLTEEVKQEMLNKIETHNMLYKREQDKLRKRALRQKTKDDK